LDAHATTDPASRERLRRWSTDRRRGVVLPSLLACDFARMTDVFQTLQALHVPGAHLDVMDGAFVPNFTYGAPVIRRWREADPSLFFDAHLMMADPGRYLDDFIAAGCDRITIHIEAVPEPTVLLRRIAAAGCLPALSLNPPTPVETIAPYLDLVDAVLVMSVMPGFGGQAFDPSVLPKAEALRRLHPGLRLQMDGGLNTQTIPAAVAAGVTEVVAGSAFFRNKGREAAAYDELAGAVGRAMESRPGVETVDTHE
jgi:ribulose-phosphate 3-epimerase